MVKKVKKIVVRAKKLKTKKAKCKKTIKGNNKSKNIRKNNNKSKKLAFLLLPTFLVFKQAFFCFLINIFDISSFFFNF